MRWSKHMRFTYKTNEPRLDTKGFKLGCYIFYRKIQSFYKTRKKSLEFTSKNAPWQLDQRTMLFNNKKKANQRQQY